MVAQESEQLNHPARRRNKMTNEERENKPKVEEKKIEAKPLPVDKEKAKEMESGLEKTVQDKPVEEPMSESQHEKKEEKPKSKKEPEKSKVVKKEEAVANGQNFPISKKQAVYICSFIKNKSIDKAIADLGEVKKMKKAVPFKGEIPHRKGGFVGRYPVKATQYFINLLKGLKGNVITNGMELEKARIAIASASWASRPMRSGGRSAKRTNVILKARETKGEKK